MEENIKSLDNIYELIDLYCGASIVGERVELIIMPNKNNPDEREITIRLQEGLSRDSDTFIVKNGKIFDEEILPQIINYYSHSDKLKEEWNIENSNIDNQISIATIETESGNLLYIETFDNKLFDRLKNKEEKLETIEISLTEEEKDWEQIIRYAKNRRVNQDFFERENLSDEEIKKIRYLVEELSKIKKFVPSYSYKNIQRVYDNLHLLLSSPKWKEQLIEIGIDKDLYDKISNLLDNNFKEKIKGTSLEEIITKNIQTERRMNSYIEKRIKNDEKFSKEKILSKITFATKELDKKGYFELRNATNKNYLEPKEDNFYGKTCPTALISLKNRYEENKDPDITSEEQKQEYITYCNELLDYLANKAIISSKKTKKISKDISFYSNQNELNKEILSNDKEKLLQLLNKIELHKSENQHNNFFLIIENHPIDKNKRLIKLSIINEKQNYNSTNFTFDDGAYLDSKIPEIIDKVLLKDEIEDFEEVPVFIPNEIDRKTVLLTTKGGNEVLMKLSNDFKIEKEKIKKEEKEDTIDKIEDEKQELTEENRQLAQYFRKEILRDKGQLPPIGIKAIEELASVNKKVAELEQAHEKLKNGEITKKDFEKIHDTYRSQLADAIKTVYKNKNLVTDNFVIAKSILPKRNTIDLKEIEKELKNAIKEKEEKALGEKLEKLEKEIKRVTQDYKEKQKNTPTVDNSDFDELHQLFINYKIQNVGGELKIFDRKTNIEYIPTDKERIKIEFANYWTAAAGIKSSIDDISIGEKYAFSNDSRELYNIMDIHFRESIKRGIPIDRESLKEQFENTRYEKADFVYGRLFKNSNYIDYVTTYYKLQILLDKKEKEKIEVENKKSEEPNNEVLVENKIEEIKDNSDEEKTNNILEIKEAYDIAVKCGTLEEPASLRVFFLKENPEQVEIIISNGNKGEEVLYQKEFTKNELMEEILPELCNIYIKESGTIYYNETFDVPNTNKSGSITLGQNDNLLQMSNAPKECVKLLQKNLKNAINNNLNTNESILKK